MGVSLARMRAMRNRSRVRRFCKWSGLTVCLLIIAAFPLSFIGSLGWHRVVRNTTVAVYALPGRISFEAAWAAPGFRYPGFASPPHGGFPHGWFLVRRREVFPEGEYAKWRRWWRWESRWRTDVDNSWHMARVPLWLVLILVLMPTLLVWYRDRRIPFGHCRKCGYDLTGNVSGVCPECGESI